MKDKTELRIRESIARHILGISQRERVDLSAVLAVVFTEVMSGACAYYGGRQTAAFPRQTADGIEDQPPLEGSYLHAAVPMGRA